MFSSVDAFPCQGYSSEIPHWQISMLAVSVTYIFSRHHCLYSIYPVTGIRSSFLAYLYLITCLYMYAYRYPCISISTYICIYVRKTVCTYVGKHIHNIKKYIFYYFDATMPVHCHFSSRFWTLWPSCYSRFLWRSSAEDYKKCLNNLLWRRHWKFSVSPPSNGCQKLVETTLNIFKVIKDKKWRL
jgi:hypothetical protein